MDFQSRILFFQILFAVVAIIFALRLFNLQVIDDSFKELATDNVVRKITTYPTRGLVFDKNKKLVVTNDPVYDILVTPRLVKNIDTAKFCSLLAIDIETFEKNLKKATKYSRYRPSIFIKQISKETYAQFQEYFYQFKGFYPQVRTLRKYPYANASHVLGDIGEVGKKEVEKPESYYQQGDYIGLTGIEKKYEESLRGEKGYRYIMVDNFNREQGEFDEGNRDFPSKTGDDIQLTLDIDLQVYGEKLMQNKLGSIVAIEPKTGEVLTMVSSPGYNPNLLSGRGRGDNFSILSTDTLKPLFNRAITAKYIPGSTFKPLVAAIALQENAIYENKYFYCGGSYSLYKMTLGCSHSHASAKNVPDAIKESCNPYFWQTFKSLFDQNSNQKADEVLSNFNNYLYEFGLGKKLTIDIPNESKGNIPTPEYYNRLYSKGAWGASTIISLGIGQGELELSILQMANIMAVFANRGYYYPPHLVHPSAKDSTNYTFYNTKKRSSIEKKHFNTVIKGLEKVGKSIYRLPKIENLDIAGKTGTADNPHGKPHSVFISFAPKDDPKIAIAVIIENSGFGATYAAPVAGLMVEKYLNKTISDKSKWIEDYVLSIDLINKKEDEQ